MKHSTYGIGEVIGASDQWVVISFKDIGMKTFSTKTLMQGNLISQPTGYGGSDMTFELWLFAEKHLAQTYQMAIEIYSNMSEEQKSDLMAEYEAYQKNA